MNVLKIFGRAALGMACCIGFVACSDGDTNEPGPQPEELRLTASPSTVKAGDEVTFTVTNNGADVTSAAQVLSLSEEGKIVTGKWSSEKPGEYQFAAVYAGRTSATQTVTVKSGISTGNYKRRVLAMDFTGTSCSACPTMTRMIDSYVSSNPDRLVVIGAHVNVPSADPLTIPDGERLAAVAGCAGSAPNMWVDYREVCSATLTTFRAKVERSINEYPAVCGVKIASSLDGQQVKASVSVRFNETGNYKICAALLEDNVNVSGSVENVYHHVLRAFATTATGDSLGECVEGQETNKEFTFTNEGAWKTDNCRVAVYVLRETAEGKYYVNNIRECGVGQTADFDYEE